MRKLLLSFASIAVIGAFMADAHAQIAASGANAGAVSGSNANSGSASSSRSQGGSGSATSGSTATNQAGASTGASTVNLNYGNNSPYSANTPSDVIVRSAPTIYAPNVVTGNVCALGASVGASWLGAGGAAGMSWESMQCERRQTAALLWNMGTPDSRAAAKEVVCNSPEIRTAYRNAGSPCLVDMAVAGPQPTPQAQPVMVAPSAVAFNPANYASGSECLNAAQSQGVPLSACGGRFR